MSVGDRTRTAVHVLLAAMLWACMLGGAGCDEGGRKASLTDEEIERLTFAQKPNRPDELIVSGETVTCDELFGPQPGQDVNAPTLREELMEAAKGTPPLVFLQQTWPRVQQRLNTRISNIVLYQRAKLQLGEKADEQVEKLAEEELSKFVLEHGGNGAAVDAALQRMGMNRTSYIEFQKRDILGTFYVRSKFPYNRPITHSELLETYEGLKEEAFYEPGVLQMRLIDIQVEKVEPADPNEDPNQAARALAQDLLARIDGGADFAELAKEHSHGYRAASGGLWRPRDPAALAAPYDVLAEASKEMEVGQAFGPIEAPGHVFVMRVEQKQDERYQPLSEVQGEVEEAILEERRIAALKQLDSKVAEQAAAARTDLFVRDCLERLYRAANSSATVE